MCDPITRRPALRSERCVRFDHQLVSDYQSDLLRFEFRFESVSVGKLIVFFSFELLTDVCCYMISTSESHPQENFRYCLSQQAWSKTSRSGARLIFHIKRSTITSQKSDLAT
ncbi:hypothetical protein YC2023_079748 [Brassica napus]